MRNRVLRVLPVGVAILLAATPALAHDPYPSRIEEGRHRHLRAAQAAGAPSPLVTTNFELVGHANLGGGVPNGDVFVFDHAAAGTFAYVGTWSAQCTGQGAKIIDVNDPSKPKWTGFVGARKGSSNEDVVVATLADGTEVLGIGVQACGKRGQAGLALYDVSDPLRPTELSFLPTAGGGVHELDIVTQPDGTTLALLALPFAEIPPFIAEFFGIPPEQILGEFWVVDITNPGHPVVLADWGIFKDSELLIQGGNDEVGSNFQGLGFFAAHFAHSVRAAESGNVAYVSYWDGGVIKLDISNPTEPTIIGRTMYPITADGDAHSMTPFVDETGTTYILQNDEDFDSGPTTALMTTSATGADEFQAIIEPWAPVGLAAPLTDDAVFIADGCDPAAYLAAAGTIAIADTVDPFYVPDFADAPECTIGDQANFAAAAGAVAFLSNLVPIDDPYPFGPDADVSGVGIPVLQITDIDDIADRIVAASETATVTVTLTPNPPTWGYLRVFAEVSDGAATDGSLEWEQDGQFIGPATTVAPGSWSIHNTEVVGDRAYSSWYSAGIVALDLTNPRTPVQVGQFVPDTSRRHANSLGTGPAEVWGVALHEGLVYASDMRSGLWIVRPIGAAAATP